MNDQIINVSEIEPLPKISVGIRVRINPYPLAYFHMRQFNIFCTTTVAQSVSALVSHAEGWMFESQPQQT